MIIGFDPAASKPNAMAVIHNEVCIITGDVDPDIHIIVGFLNKHKPDLAAIEGQFFGPNAKTLIQLAEARGRLIAACELAGIPFQIIQPQQWLASIGLKPNQKHTKERDQRIIQLAKALLKYDPGNGFNIDHAAAVHIGFYAARRFTTKTKLMRDKF